MSDTNETKIRSKLKGRMENNALKRIGREMRPDGLEYCGSIAVHFYRAGSDANAAFINQVALDKVAEGVAQRGIKNVTEQLMFFYGRKPENEFFKK